MLTQARLKEVLKYDRKTGVFTWLKRGKGHPNRKQSAAGCLSGKYQRIRVTWGRFARTNASLGLL